MPHGVMSVSIPDVAPNSSGEQDERARLGVQASERTSMSLCVLLAVLSSVVPFVSVSATMCFCVAANVLVCFRICACPCVFVCVFVCLRASLCICVSARVPVHVSPNARASECALARVLRTPTVSLCARYVEEKEHITRCYAFMCCVR